MDKSHSSAPRHGAVDPAVAAELPGLRLDWLAVTVAPGSTSARSRSPAAERLRALSDRYRGATVIAMRTHPIPRAYRTFYRQIGLDPDVERIPSERAATERLLHGGFRSTDADLRRVRGGRDRDGRARLGAGRRCRRSRSRPGSGSGWRMGPARPPRSLVVRDRRTVHAPLFGTPLPGHEPRPSAATVVLYAFGVAGVPQIHIDEALWTRV